MTENYAIKELLLAGEMVTKSSLEKLIETSLLQMMDKKGVVIDGYPRDMNQVRFFEEKVTINYNSNTTLCYNHSRFYFF